MTSIEVSPRTAARRPGQRRGESSSLGIVGTALIAGIFVVEMSAGQARPAASSNPRLDGLKKAAAADVDGMREFTQQMVDQIFSYAELGYQEIETSKYLTDVLEKNGFRIERNVAGMPTGWTATWGSGRPVIALGSDIDDIPQASQKPGVAYHDPIVAGAPGHGEGHNSGMPVQVTAALAVKKIMERERLPGTLKLWPGVAEELGGGKAYFVRAGVFKDVDVCLFTHVGSNFNVSYGDRLGTGVVSVEYAFTGESAHAAANPWRGRSALDAVELMNVGWNFRREHLRLQHRSHYVITSGGDQPNVVPSNASVWYYFREIDYPHIKELREIGDTMAKGGGDDDQHRGELENHRRRVAAALQQGRRRNDLREHESGRPAQVGTRTTSRWPRPSRKKSASRRPGSPWRSDGCRVRFGPKTTTAADRTISATCRGTCRR